MCSCSSTSLNCSNSCEAGSIPNFANKRSSSDTSQRRLRVMHSTVISGSLMLTTLEVSNGPIQFESARTKIGLCSNCSQKLDECSLARARKNFCKCSYARIFVKIPCRVAQA